MHATLETPVIPEAGIELTVAVTEGETALAYALENDGVQVPAIDEVYRWVEPIRGEARTGAKTVRARVSHRE